MRVFLREWREYLGLTQEQIAERIGITKGTVSRMETKDREPNLGYLAAFAEAIDREVGELFRSPDVPTRDELLRGYSNEELTAALQLVEHSRARALRASDDLLGLPDDDRGDSSRKRTGTRDRR
jgi:transcriptional regulator with XRE-family HTH domain